MKKQCSKETVGLLVGKLTRMRSWNWQNFATYWNRKSLHFSSPANTRWITLFPLFALWIFGEEVSNKSWKAKIYNSVQMFEPFWDGNPHSFGKISVSLFFMWDFQKRIRSISLWPNHWGKKILRKIWIFVEVIFNFSSEIGFFGLTWRVPLL